MNVGLIGYGTGGRIFHAPILAGIPEFALSKIYTTNPVSVAEIGRKYQNTQVVSDVEDILGDPDIQLIVVATPNGSHFDFAKRALENGHHVVVEKPFTVTSLEADQLIAVAQRTGQLLTVYHNRRWDSDFKTVARLLQSNVLGDLVEYEAAYDRYRPELKGSWKEDKAAPGGGILYDLGVHLIDQALCLFGLPQEIMGYIDTQRKTAQTTDCFELIMKYNSLKVVLKAGMLIREPRPRFSLFGTRGSYVKHGFDVQEKALAEGLMPNQCKNWGQEPEALFGQINTEIDGVQINDKIKSEAGDYRDFYRNVCQAIKGEDELAVTPQQARNAIRIIEIAEMSSKEKRWLQFE